MKLIYFEEKRVNEMYKFIVLLLILLGCKDKEVNIKEDLNSNVKKIQKDTVSIIEKEIDDNRYKGPTGIYKNKVFNEQIYAEITTSMGKMTFELFPHIAPLAVENFVYLAKRGYYNNNQFFRVIESFVVQTGDSTNTGTGNLGYYFPTEVSEDLIHDRIGVLSYANYDTETNGTQFFITLSEQPNLDGKHPAFGFIVSGKKILKKIGSVDTDRGNRPLKKVFIKNIKIIGL